MGPRLKYFADIGTEEKFFSNSVNAHRRQETPLLPSGSEGKTVKAGGAYLENLGTYNPTQQPAEIKLKMDRVLYWLGKGAQPTDTVDRFVIKASDKQQAERSL